MCVCSPPPRRISRSRLWHRSQLEGQNNKLVCLLSEDKSSQTETEPFTFFEKRPTENAISLWKQGEFTESSLVRLHSCCVSQLDKRKCDPFALELETLPHIRFDGFQPRFGRTRLGRPSAGDKMVTRFSVGAGPGLKIERASEAPVLIMKRSDGGQKREDGHAFIPSRRFQQEETRPDHRLIV